MNIVMSNYVENKKAKFNYEILEELEVGIKLNGFETKSVRNGKASLDGSYAVVRGGELFLINARIEPYQPKNTPESYDKERSRILLASKKEIAKLADFEVSKGLTLVPISMYNKGRVIKLRLAVAKGKKKGDKRQTIKKREAEREIRRTLKNG